jgi:hypothetical protein
MLGQKKKRKEEENYQKNTREREGEKEREKEKEMEREIEKRSKDKNKSNQNFLMKLYQILETPELSNVIEWGENGKFFLVKNITEFTEKVLPRFFKHNNFASFVRQVNLFLFILINKRINLIFI